MSIPNNMFHSVLPHQPTRVQMLPRRIHNILKRSQRHGNIVLVHLAFFRDGFGDAFAEGPEGCELGWGLREDAGGD